MSGINRFTQLTTTLLLTATVSLTAYLPGQAQPDNPEARCQAQALSFGASRRDKARAAYLCENATSIAPAQCYWKALSFGATRQDKRRAAELCQGATSTDPASCYWNALGFGATHYDKRQAATNCKTPAPIVIPPELTACVQTYQTKLNVTPDTALTICTEQIFLP